MLLLLEPGQDFLLPQGLRTVETGLKSGFLILKKNMVFKTCIQAGFTHTKPRKSSGHIGQGISTSTDTLMHLKILIQNFITLLRIKITL